MFEVSDFKTSKHIFFLIERSFQPLSMSSKKKLYIVHVETSRRECREKFQICFGSGKVHPHSRRLFYGKVKKVLNVRYTLNCRKFFLILSPSTLSSNSFKRCMQLIFQKFQINVNVCCQLIQTRQFQYSPRISFYYLTRNTSITNIYVNGILNKRKGIL